MSQSCFRDLDGTISFLVPLTYNVCIPIIKLLPPTYIYLFTRREHGREIGSTDVKVINA